LYSAILTAAKVLRFISTNTMSFASSSSPGVQVAISQTGEFVGNISKQLLKIPFKLMN
jgi:uncharacterized membrane protein YecN with MAPEG domain